MSRTIRTLRPDVVIDDVAAAGLSDTAWRLWVGMRLLADDYGNARAAETFLAGRIWQDTRKAKAVAKAMTELADGGWVSTYRAGTEVFAHIAGWQDEQRNDRRSEHTRNPSPDYPYRATSRGPVETSVEVIRDVRSIFAATRGEPPPPAATRREKSKSAVVRGRDPDPETDLGNGNGSPNPPVDRPIVEPRTFVIPDCYAVAYAKGAERGSGAPVVKPSSRSDTERLLQIVHAHARDASGREIHDTAEVCAWLEAAAEDFARSTDERGNRPKLAVWSFENWSNERHRGPAMRPGLQRPAPGQPSWSSRNATAAKEPHG